MIISNLYSIVYLAHYEKGEISTGPGYRYKGWKPNDDSNYVVDMVEYFFERIPKFQYIVDESGRKVKFGGWLSIRMNTGELPVII